MIEVAPRVLLEVISVTPAIRLRLLSSGVATAEAMVSGLAPGRLAPTEMVGNSTWGNGATGSRKYPIKPERVIATVSRVVPTGRRMKASEKFGPWMLMIPRVFLSFVRGHRTKGRSPVWYRASGLG